MRNPVRMAFDGQRQAAKSRGIKWYFTFEEWVNWWEDQLGTRWFEKRGRFKDQYVMARDKDKGPYASWNVQCITSSQNVSDMSKNGSLPVGKRHPMAKLTEEQVREIYLSKDLSLEELTRKHNTVIAQIYRIKSRKIWRNVTADLGPPQYKSGGRGARTDLLPFRF